MPPPVAACLKFVGGTLELRGLESDSSVVPSGFKWDKRTRCFRAPAFRYAAVVLALRAEGVDLEDEARAYSELQVAPVVQREARPFQQEALRAWLGAQGRGVVVLPTGAGKSHLAAMAIADRRRNALVVAPTLDLVRQWYDLLRTTFGCEVGVVGGGEHSIHPLTVTTYDSAHIHMDHLGARFGVVVFDECHHLPGSTYAQAAQLCLAPFRLGLTATPERPDGRDALLDELIGPVVYSKPITELSGSYLAEYDTERIFVELSPAEREEYESERALYRGFVRDNGIRFGSPAAWSDFIMVASRTPAGRRALQAHRRQRELAVAAPAKLDCVRHLLGLHRHERALIFTQDNATAYAVSRRFLVPAITHQTKVTERSRILQRLSKGEYLAVVTSRVLNEGVDVPEASVAIVLGGSGSVREHVQRLGRVLRQREGKRAILYEVISAGTAETATSERRREHVAYR